MKTISLNENEDLILIVRRSSSQATSWASTVGSWTEIYLVIPVQGESQKLVTECIRSTLSDEQKRLLKKKVQ
jgi:hypothetical protein